MDPTLGDLQQVPVLPIDQIRSIRANNDYVERPQIASFSSKQAQSNPSISQKYEWAQDRLIQTGVDHQDLHRSQSHQHHHHHGQHLQQHLSRSSTISSVSRSSTASDQRLLVGLTPSQSGHAIIRTQPKGDLKPEELLKVVEQPDLHAGHLFICEQCGRCKCNDCTAPRSLPSRWICDQRCLCSPENVLDYGTCLCCIKGLFYHCSSDDEDNCADDPCSCNQGGQCCSRWAAISFFSVLMPCLCCYLPAKGCLKLCQKCYDGIKRPGCRCKNHTNTVCRKISSSSGTPFPKALDKPV
ncbi:protein sprouty homolog 3 [Latimeria chalumnae]|uniref:Sprouty RTK signaling antagonist 3 n=1 Tax=Latimeria chalumnae TaxID=7897 RepID=H3AX71_LATCH|nr:PREDICTED: protein sprouty homolog 3 [Latimeria chalumnae]|eukprot:XP_014343108.1 PREDICTED: protein sprouty homolog 3 [Latimeria chalumnae]